MTKEKKKAIELIEKLYKWSDGWLDIGHDVTHTIQAQKAAAKQCALICVDEILDAIPMYQGGLSDKWKFYQSVRKEIENP